MPKMPVRGKKMQYKLRLFYPSVVMPYVATGRIEVRKGSKDYILDLIRSKIDKCQKIIVEVV